MRHIAFAAFISATASVSSVSAMPVAPVLDTSLIITVADGCGPARYRGPGGACHRYGRGPYPNGFYEPAPAFFGGNGCPPGFWRGPWGHCRNTPYHGGLPGGGWKY